MSKETQNLEGTINKGLHIGAVGRSYFKNCGGKFNSEYLYIYIYI